jgi:two-component SAPR family response regulator
MADNYWALGEKEKAEAIYSELANKSIEYIAWYLTLDDMKLASVYENCVRNFYMLDEINKSLMRSAELEEGDEMASSSEMALHYAKKFEELYGMFNDRVKQN